MQKTVLGALLALAAAGCTEPAPLEVWLPGDRGELLLPSANAGGADHLPFYFKCTLEITSFGSVTPQGSHNVIDDRVFECDVAGDFEGHLTVIWDHGLVHNPGQPDIALNLLIRYDLRVTEAFGEAVGDGGLTGAVQIDIAEFRGEPTPVQLHGDGELRGVVLHGVDDDQGTGNGRDRVWAGYITGRSASR